MRFRYRPRHQPTFHMTARRENRTGPADPGPLDAMSRFRITYDGPALETGRMTA
ncbi:hypothetical protein BLA17378_01731 [Burkholderia aenigmatica]|uniref:Uncharacterized protein n=1 Tax=Burkholderia aenigmatica TaxID=2015348 RepID=A0ABY6XMK6_9BURK|nr:hypothetical protein BLA17378_01731 [Burkholderia aenigmatica]VWC81503.1 hypothetical protein BLA18628_01237 [Burkholderia aenigmatica]